MDFTAENSGDTRLALWSPSAEEVRTFDLLACASLGILPTSKVIFTEMLNTVRATSDDGCHVDLTHVATPCRYRFIDCLAFTRDHSLQLVETSSLPRDMYAAISHTWASALPRPNMHTQRGSFLVECEERNDGGPISIDVLHYTCLAALQEGVRFLWLDRLCILQTLKKGESISIDKRWQIMHMHDIYQQCRVTLILTTGLRRFSDKFETAGWVERAWTFQEAMVAPEAKVLFVDYSVAPNPSPPVQMLPVDTYFKMQPTGSHDHDGALERQQQFIHALDSRVEFRSNNQVEILARYQNIWQFMQWRTSARQADVVFSVMSMLGVTLDPSKFQKNDRFGATLALAQEMLHNDHRENTCVEIPMWKKIDKASILDSCKGRGMPAYNVHDYLMRLPSIIDDITQLENELDKQTVPAFRGLTKRLLGLDSQEDSDRVLVLRPEQLEREKRRVEAHRIRGLGKSTMEDVRRRLLEESISNVLAKTKRRADALAEEIPSTLMQQVLELGKEGKTLIPFTTSQRVVVGLCKQLHHSIPHQPAGSQTSQLIPICIFGWSIQHVLWLQMIKQLHGDADPATGQRPNTIPVPVVTFWKFTITKHSKPQA